MQVMSHSSPLQTAKHAAARAAQTRYNRRHPKLVRKRQARYRADNRAKIRIYHDRWYTKNRVAQRIRVINKAAAKAGLPLLDPATVPPPPLDGLCQLCHKPKRLGIEHSHKTGRFRGWTCHNCNSGIGLFSEDVELMERVIAYLKCPK